MTRYTVELEFKTPHSAGKGAGAPNHKLAHLVLPGRTLRGAFAAHWWRTVAAGPDAFAALFDRDLLVTQAVPEGAKLTSTAKRVCKYLCGKEVDLAAYVLANRDAPTVCPWCRGPLTSEVGWHAQTAARPRTRSALTHGPHGTSTAADGQLFSREYRPSARHECTIITRDDLGWLDGAQVRIGGELTNDNGRAIVRVSQAPEPSSPDEKGQALILASPALLSDAYGAASLELPALASELCRVSGDDLDVRMPPGWLRSELVTGWHGRANLPYPSEWALAAGTTVLVHGLSDRGWAQLQAGIGWRTMDGYGQLMLGATAASIPDPAGVWKKHTEPLKKSRKWPTVKPALIKAMKSRAKGGDLTESVDAVVGVDSLTCGPLRSHIETILTLTAEDLTALVPKIESKELK